MTTALALALLNFAFNLYDRAKEKQSRGAELTEEERNVLKAEQRAEEERFDRNREADAPGNPGQ